MHTLQASYGAVDAQVLLHMNNVHAMIAGSIWLEANLVASRVVYVTYDTPHLQD